jgi:hypothetical protein
MDHHIPHNMIVIISNIVRKQNKQLLKIICKEEDIDYECVKHLIQTNTLR